MQLLLAAKMETKFCKFTGFREENLIVVSDNKIHNNLKVSGGLDIGLGFESICF